MAAFKELNSIDRVNQIDEYIRKKNILDIYLRYTEERNIFLFDKNKYLSKEMFERIIAQFKSNTITLELTNQFIENIDSAEDLPNTYELNNSELMAIYLLAANDENTMKLANENNCLVLNWSLLTKNSDAYTIDNQFSLAIKTGNKKHYFNDFFSFNKAFGKYKNYTSQIIICDPYLLIDATIDIEDVVSLNLIEILKSIFINCNLVNTKILEITIICSISKRDKMANEKNILETFIEKMNTFALKLNAKFNYYFIDEAKLSDTKNSSNSGFINKFSKFLKKEYHDRWLLSSNLYFTSDRSFNLNKRNGYKSSTRYNTRLSLHSVLKNDTVENINDLLKFVSKVAEFEKSSFNKGIIRTS